MVCYHVSFVGEGGRWARTPGLPARLAFSPRRFLEVCGWCFFFFYALEGWLGYVHKATGLLVVFVDVRWLFLPALGGLFLRRCCVRGVTCATLVCNLQRLLA